MKKVLERYLSCILALFIIICSVEIGFATDKNTIIYSKNASNIERNSNDVTEEPNEEDNWKLELFFL